MSDFTFTAGMRVRVRPHGDWPDAMEGTIEDPPEDADYADWNGCWCDVDALGKTRRLYWVTFDEPARRLTDDGTVPAGAIDERFMDVVA